MSESREQDADRRTLPTTRSSGTAETRTEPEVEPDFEGHRHVDKIERHGAAKRRPAHGVAGAGQAAGTLLCRAWPGARAPAFRAFPP